MWDTFANNGQNAVIEFKVRASRVTPGSTIINTALASWNSLPDSLSGSQSPLNPLAVRRSYQPNDPVDTYASLSSAQITIPALPDTGFAPGKITPLPAASQEFQDLGSLWLEVPSLGVQNPIVGVPLRGGEWDISWLYRQAGYLQGTKYPTQEGNSALTAHVYLPDGTPGPFVNLHTLKWGDQVILHNNDLVYIYEVRQILRIDPKDPSVLQPSDRAWVTLLTCQGFDEASGQYRWRIAVRAVLMKVESH